jgi:prefoldin alpha subunit
MEKQDYIARLGMLQQEAERINQENENVARQINDLQILKLNLEYFSSAKGSESLVSLGNGIYTKADVKERSLWVNIGANTVVKKSVSETNALIDEQIGKLGKIREQIAKEMDSLNAQLNMLIEDARHAEETP